MYRLGTLARFFHTPIAYFEEMDDVLLEGWWHVMNLTIQRENEAVRRANQPRRGG